MLMLFKNYTKLTGYNVLPIHHYRPAKNAVTTSSCPHKGSFGDDEDATQRSPAVSELVSQGERSAQPGRFLDSVLSSFVMK